MLKTWLNIGWIRGVILESQAPVAPPTSSVLDFPSEACTVYMYFIFICLKFFICDIARLKQYLLTSRAEPRERQWLRRRRGWRRSSEEREGDQDQEDVCFCPSSWFVSSFEIALDLFSPVFNLHLTEPINWISRSFLSILNIASILNPSQSCLKPLRRMTGASPLMLLTIWPWLRSRFLS